ncbi:hypothetical protein HRO26_03875 [Treponema pectinovorum]|uniref:hypothetical protein n=1 Tax=Treponema pectinovorum TaxID=164 RepID=UPI003D913D8A
MVDSISLNAYSYGGIVSGSNNKIYVSVNPSAVIYSQFEHISGVASHGSDAGVSVSKIQILNSLINQLITMRNEPKVNLKDDNSLNESQVETLIKNYQEQIQKEIDKASITGYGLAGVAPEAGQILSFTA